MNKILLLLVLPAVAFALPPVEIVSDKNAIDSKGYIVTTAGFTHSMEPYIHGGETLLMKKYNGQELQVGMLIVVSRWDRPNGVLHTVTDVSKTHVRTQGMNCVYSDGWKEKKYIYWIVERVVQVTKK